MKKYLVLLAGFVIQVCLGSVYAWSVIGAGFRTELGLLSWQTELIYGLSIGTFAFGTMFTGNMVYRFGPRLMSLVSGGLFALAFTIGAMSGGNFFLLLLGMGLTMGAAISFGYVCPLSTAVAWFPQHKGLVTGLAVMGFGGGSMISGALINALSGSGLSMLAILQILGPLAGLAIVISALFLTLPEQRLGLSGTRPGTTPRILPHEKQFYRTPVFWALALSMFLGTIGGLIVIGKITSIAQEYKLGVYGPLSLAVLASGNALGRLLWGSLMDRLGSRAIFISFGLMSAGFMLLTLANGSLPIFLAGTLLTGLQFGASLVIFATFTEKYYGAGAIGRVYPYVFAFYGLAALTGPWLGGILHDTVGSYEVLLMMLACLPLLGLLVSRGGIRTIKSFAQNR